MTPVDAFRAVFVALLHQLIARRMQEAWEVQNTPDGAP